MFHSSTTIHHRRSEFSASGREKRVVHLNWFAQKKLQSAQVWDYFRGPRKMVDMAFKPITKPIAMTSDLAMKGMGHAADGIEVGTYTAIEVAKGAATVVAKPPAMTAWSRIVALKRTLWDTGWSAFRAAILTPIRVAMSPIEAGRGVRDAVKGVFGHGKEFFKSLYNRKLGGVISNARGAIGSLFQPIVRPVRSILAPAAMIAATAFGAQWQTVTTVRDQITKTIPEGINRIRNAPAVASSILAEKKAMRAAIKATLEKEKEEKREALKAAVATEKGESSGGGGGGAPKKA